MAGSPEKETGRITAQRLAMDKSPLQWSKRKNNQQVEGTSCVVVRQRM
jgi:hypothetical protein